MALEQPIGTALLHVESDVGAGIEAFARWCDVHDRELMATDGYLSVRRFEVAPLAYASPGGARYLTMYELSDERAGQDPTPTGDTSPLPDTITGLVSTSTLYRRLSPDRGAWTASGVTDGPSQPIGAAVLHVAIDVDPDHDVDYNAWYDEEHLPALVAAPRVLSARRFVDARGLVDGRHRYLSLYQLDDVDVVETGAFAKAGAPSPRSAVLAPYRTIGVQLYRQVFATPRRPRPDGRPTDRLTRPQSGDPQRDPETDPKDHARHRPAPDRLG